MSLHWALTVLDDALVKDDLHSDDVAIADDESGDGDGNALASDTCYS